MTEKTNKNPDDVWLHKQEGYIHYFVHRPTRHCGIHIRGLAELCGVHHSSLQNALKWAKKGKGDLAENYETDLYILLKDRDIFLVDLAENSPKLRGQAVKVILADVCFDIAFYYAEKGYKKAFNTARDMGRLGAESFIFYKTGFDVTEHIQVNRMIVNGIEVLTYATKIEVNKTTTAEVVYYTDRKTGKCGMSLDGIYALCGGIVSKTKILQFLGSLDNPFVMAGAHGADIIDADAAERALYHYGHVATPRKSQKAKSWLATMGSPISKFIANHTGYIATSSTEDMNTLRKSIEELRRENERLRNQLGLYDEKGCVRWHPLLGTVLNYQLSPSGAVVKAEVETTVTPQRVDFVIENLGHKPSPHGVLDGLDPTVDYNVVTYKSHNETLDAHAIHQLIGYYIGFSKSVDKAQEWQGCDVTYNLVAVCTKYPQALEKQAAGNWVKVTDGVYQINLLMNITIVVTSQVAKVSRNSSWLLFSHDKELVEYALALPENAQIPDYIPRLLRDELERSCASNPVTNF